LHTNSNRLTKLCQTCELVQPQQLILGCGAPGIYHYFTFIKSACNELSADIKIVLVLVSNQELCFIEYQRNFVPDLVNCSLMPISVWNNWKK